jgi:uncharacterized OB-fold protein
MTSQITSPEPNNETAEFWAAANENRLILRRCKDTGKSSIIRDPSAPSRGHPTPNGSMRAVKARSIRSA